MKTNRKPTEGRRAPRPRRSRSRRPLRTLTEATTPIHQNVETWKPDRWSSEPPRRECCADRSNRRPREWFRAALAGILFHERRNLIGRSQFEGTARMLRRMGARSGSVSASSSMAISTSLSSSGENPADPAKPTELGEGGQSGEEVWEGSERSEMWESWMNSVE